MNTNEPLISVLMGVRYIRDDLFFLKRAVASIMAQTYQRIELLICDDGSTSGAAEYLAEAARKDLRIRLIRRPGCLDLASKLNLCLTAAKGAYIARMDDDDYSRSDRLEKQVSFLLENKDIAFVGCNVDLYRNGEKVGRWEFPERPMVRDFYINQPYIHPTLMFHREALEVVKGYSEDRRQVLCEDYDLLLRLYAEGYQGANLQEVLFDYTLPATARGSRRMGHRWNETVTRWQRFKNLGVLPGALPWVVKPLAVGLLPESLLKGLKDRKRRAGKNERYQNFCLPPDRHQ
ncbi:MAG: glycosyltransferase [Oscillibacter sp.]|nr:glycosyltransferase [Oscillibacter sp.]